MTSSFARAVVSLPGKERLGKHAHGGRIVIHATAAETGGVLGSWDTFSAPGTGPAWHIHTRETEVFRVISGRYRFWCGTEQFEGGPGLTVTLPPHVPHRWRNESDSIGQMLGLVTPGGFEQFFIEIGRLRNPSLAEMLAIEGSLGVVNGGPALEAAIADIERA